MGAAGSSPGGRRPTQNAPFRGLAPVSMAVSLACSRRARRDLAGPASHPIAPTAGAASATSPTSQRPVAAARLSPPAARRCSRRRMPPIRAPLTTAIPAVPASAATVAGAALPPVSSTGESSRGLTLMPSATASRTEPNSSSGLNTMSRSTDGGSTRATAAQLTSGVSSMSARPAAVASPSAAMAAAAASASKAECRKVKRSLPAP